MARPHQPGLAYYNNDTNRYSDPKIKRLRHLLGATGVAVFDYVLNEIYRIKGCFLKWDDSARFDVADYWRLNESEIQKIIDFCAEIGLFNNEHYTAKNLLTSLSIQERYRKVCIEAKRKNWLIPPEIELIRESMELFPEETGINGGESTQSKVKESKGNKSKVKESTEVPALELFLSYVKENVDNYEGIKNAATLKYKSWAAAEWHDGNGALIKNWKSKILNTIPHLKIETHGSKANNGNIATANKSGAGFGGF